MGALFTCHYLEQKTLEGALQKQNESSLREAALLASRIQAKTNSTFYLIVGLARLIEINGGISDQQFNEICSRLVSSRPGLRNIAAAPDMVIRHIYPLAGNEAALGLDYAKIAAQKEAAYRAKETGQPVVTNPVDLVQGGQAIIGRFPVYIPSSTGEERKFWGIISTPLDTNYLYQSVGLLDPDLSIQLSLRGRDAMGGRGEVFFGSADIDDKKPLRFPIELLSSSWEMAAIPKGGWIQAAPNAWMIRFIVGTLATFLIIMVILYYLYAKRHEQSKKAERLLTRMKERFYANMSHELRTPLNGIYGMSELIQTADDVNEAREYADSILKSASTLTHLLDDLLVLSQYEEASVAHYKTIDLQTFLTQIWPPLEQEAKGKGIQLKLLPIPESCATLESEPSMLRQILWNLLSNAVKFTASGEVSLEVAMPVRNEYCFTITDTGIGIDPDQLTTIFDDFVQGDDSNTRRFGGAGLGLAIVRRFAHRLGGSIEVSSEKGVGSVFLFKLPKTQK
ncbi:MAG: hypothetical protein EA353_08400 [Puniceicoccaceae bacterium]|nr:MAG: hypothetical protein EA353_08400 [Puniceicoccaceae bacterium]